MNNKATIPEEDIQIVRELCKKAHSLGLKSFSGRLVTENWGAEISFSWSEGRHGEDMNSVNIQSQFFVATKVNLKSPPPDTLQD